MGHAVCLEPQFYFENMLLKRGKVKMAKHNIAERVMISRLARMLAQLVGKVPDVLKNFY